MSRLIGRKQILAYFGYSEENHRAWKEIQLRYASILRTDALRGKPWTTQEECDVFDRESPIGRRKLRRKVFRPMKTPEAAYKRKMVVKGCEVCGWTFPPYPSLVNLHHLPVNGTVSPLEERFILLCPNHHAIVHASPDLTSHSVTKTALIETLQIRSMTVK